MNCKTTQRRLLTLAHPDRVPAAVRDHLAECAACREMQRRLAQVERHIPLLHVPSSTFTKAAFVRRLQRGPTVGERVVQSLEAVPAAVRRLGPTRVAAGLAAALLLMVVGWRLAPRPDDSPGNNSAAVAARPDTLLKKLFKQELDLAEARQPRPQVETLASMADDLHGTAQVLALTPEGKAVSRDVAEWYGQVLRTVTQRAAALEVKDRRPVLGPLVQRLDRAAQKAEAVAREIDAPATHPLHGMATAARQAKDALETLSRKDARLPPRGFGGGRVPFAVVGSMPVLFGTAAPAEESPMPAYEEARRFQRNYDLIETVVKNSLALAVEEDPIRRAVFCGNVARSLARAIEQAATEREGDRAAELGEHLRDQLQRGMAVNLTAAAAQTPTGSLRERELLGVIGDLNRTMQPLDDHLRRPELQSTLKAIHDGRAQVNKATQGRDNRP